MKHCPCGSSQPYESCCGAFILGLQFPVTPEALMRSRYTAYTEANMEYIVQTMKSPAADDFDMEFARQWAKSVKWLRLEVVSATVDQANMQGSVEFFAHYTQNNKQYAMHEMSEFRCDEGRWFYVDGQDTDKRLLPTGIKISRNDPCPCGSQKKYKKCCSSKV